MKFSLWRLVGGVASATCMIVPGGNVAGPGGEAEGDPCKTAFEKESVHDGGEKPVFSAWVKILWCYAKGKVISSDTKEDKYWIHNSNSPLYVEVLGHWVFDGWVHNYGTWNTTGWFVIWVAKFEFEPWPCAIPAPDAVAASSNDKTDVCGPTTVKEIELSFYFYGDGEFYTEAKIGESIGGSIGPLKG
jgi:hypothetical protein